MNVPKTVLVYAVLSAALLAGFAAYVAFSDGKSSPELAAVTVLAIFGLLFLLFFGYLFLAKRGNNGDLFRHFSLGKGGGYERLVAWIERKYGKVDPTWSLGRAAMYMSDVLSREKRTVKDEKRLAGLSRYIELQKYRGLIKDGN